MCAQDIQSPMGNMCFQPEASIHTYGALPTAVLSKTYSGVGKPGKFGKNTAGMMMLLSLLIRVQDNKILPKWYEETTGLCFDLHRPSQPTCSHFYLWVQVPGHLIIYCTCANEWAAMVVLPEGWH